MAKNTARGLCFLLGFSKYLFLAQMERATFFGFYPPKIDIYLVMVF